MQRIVRGGKYYRPTFYLKNILQQLLGLGYMSMSRTILIYPSRLDILREATGLHTVHIFQPI